MGRVSNSFKNQIGRDAGKVVTNFLFGDKHATPFRRVSAENSKKKIEIEERKIKINEDISRNTDLYALDKAVIEAVDKVIANKIPDNEKEIVLLINDCEIQLESNGWTKVSGDEKEKAKIRNKYPDAVLIKYEQCLTELKFSNGNQERIKYVENKLLKYKKRQKKAKYAELFNVIKILGVMLIGFLIMLIASNL